MIRNPAKSIPKGGEVGRVTTPAVIENNFDVRLARSGAIPADRVRRVEVPDALVETGATSLRLPTSLIEALGLEPLRGRSARTAGGMVLLTVFSEVLLSVQDRDTVVRVTEIPEGSPVLIGQIPPEDMDLVSLPREQRLIPNPAHGGEWTIEVY